APAGVLPFEADAAARRLRRRYLRLELEIDMPAQLDLHVAWQPGIRQRADVRCAVEKRDSRAEGCGCLPELETDDAGADHRQRGRSSAKLEDVVARQDSVAHFVEYRRHYG